MDFLVHDDPAGFWAETGPLYEADPIKHTIALTVLSTLRAVQPNGDVPTLLVSITDGGKTVGGAFCTPPWPLGVSGVPVAAIDDLVAFLRDTGYTPNGVSGPREPADAFAAAWGGPLKVLMDMRCYRLHELAQPEVPGELRLAELSDIPVLAAYDKAFMAEAAEGAGGDDNERRTRQSLMLGNAHGMWHHDGEVRSAARASQPLRGMSRVGLVYTPPEQRRHGYGAAVTAGVSQWALDNGASDVVLFTDLANPVSNSIYQRIGYVPVYDAVEYAFTHSGPQSLDGRPRRRASRGSMVGE